MGYEIGTLTKGGGDDCHYQMLAKIKALAEANGWTTLRYDTSTENHEWIGKSAGLSGTEEIFIGYRTYQSQTADYYNLVGAAFTGYLSGNSFDSQPGAKLSGLPAHNNAITYYMTINAQRIVFMLKVGTPVYTHSYIGKMFPYSRPEEYPNPLVVAGCLDGAAPTRFSDASLYFPYHGQAVGGTNSHFALRLQDGGWESPAMFPFSQGANSGTDCNILAENGGSARRCQVPANGFYQIEPIIIHTRTYHVSLNNNIWGELDGVHFCSGFNNTVENIVQSGGSSIVDQTGMDANAAVSAIHAVGGKAFVMGQNINKTLWRDYVAIEMEV